MPNLPISQLPELTAVTTNAEYAVSQNGVTYRVKSAYTSSGLIYGAFTSSVTQSSLGQANTIIAMSAETALTDNGISVVDGSKFTVASGGTFNVQFSAQMDRTQGGSNEFVTIWFRINGADIPNSSTYVSMNSNNTVIIPSWNYVTPLNAGDYIEIMWSSTTQYVTMPYTAIATLPTRPSAPSLIVTIVQV